MVGYTISSMYWIDQIVEEFSNDDSDGTWCLKILEKDGRWAVWRMCKTLGVETHGVPGQACRLLERYLVYEIRLRTNTQEEEEMQRAILRNWLRRKFLLMMASCIQLAAKMCSADMEVNANFIRIHLACRGLVFTIDDINRSELRVFSALGFRVPLRTSVEAGQMLAMGLEMPENLIEAVGLFVDMAEYHRDTVNHQVWTTSFKPCCYKNKDSVRTAHLVAGAVVACSVYFSFSPDPAPYLAAVTQAPLCYIRCISNLILMTERHVESDQICKRRSSDESEDDLPGKRRRQYQ